MFEHLRKFLPGTAKNHATQGSDTSCLSDEAKRILATYVKELGPGLIHRWEVDPAECDSGKAILDGDIQLQAEVTVVAHDRICRIAGEYRGQLGAERVALQCLLSRLFRRHLAFSSERVLSMIQQLSNASLRYCWGLPIRGFLALVDRHVDKDGRSDRLDAALRVLKEHIHRAQGSYAEGRQHVRKIEEILGTFAESGIEPGEVWTDSILEALNSMGDDERLAWQDLFAHATTAKSSRPSSKWQTQAAAHIERIGRDTFRRRLREWFPKVGTRSNKPWTREHQWQVDPNLLISERNADVLKGLAWSTIPFANAEVCRAVGDLGETCLKKIPCYGPRSQKVGNACIVALGACGDVGIAQLARLRLKIRYASAQKLIGSSLSSAAEKTGLTSDELEEMAVPGYGFEPEGFRRETIGEFQAELSIVSSTKTELLWVKPDGKRQKLIPAAVIRDHNDDVKELKQAAKDLETMLPAQRARVERFLLDDRCWPLALWRERYLDHPLVGYLARRLIWQFREGERKELGVFYNGTLVNVYDDKLSWPNVGSSVRLWHPIESDPSEVHTWRTWLEQHKVTQPFKQAHREIYVLTDAERETGTYSNRFAGHILRQHQFTALCQQRGWRYTLQGAWDSHNTPTLELPRHDIVVEYWVDATGEYGPDTSDAGVFMHVATDQVRFGDVHRGPLRLEDISPRIFSEVLRDVDLFVGVCSVGNDPTWADGGPEGRYRQYWNSYSFGELSESAKNRYEILERLVPRLKIANRCVLSEKFLLVRGDVRTYKIHLGSANILMEPNDQYLCIVPSRGQNAAESGKVFLPFEGDSVLSIILSKAFLLAEDTKIKDPSIRSQIGMRK